MTEIDLASAEEVERNQALVAPRKRRFGARFSTEEIEAALLVLALNAGNSARASKSLAAQGIYVEDRTLRAWRNDKHAERYLEICKEQAPRIEARAARRAWENVQAASEVVAKAIDRADQQLEDPRTDAASVAYKLSLTQGIQQDKALAIEGRPSVITANVDLEDLLHDLNTTIPGCVQFDAEGTAEDA